VVTAKIVRRALTGAALAYLTAVGVLIGDVSLPVLNVLLIGAALPVVWLLVVFAAWSANRHAARYAKDVQKEYGGRPVRLPERAR
jgi:hypothetical protein